MSRKPINQVVSEALRYYMEKGEWNESTLGKKADVAPNTVGNYLHPAERARGKSGKEPSAKLTELDRLAHALGVHVADLVTDRSDSEREKMLRERAAEHYRIHGELPSWAPKTSPSEPTTPTRSSARKLDDTSPKPAPM